MEGWHHKTNGRDRPQERERERCSYAVIFTIQWEIGVKVVRIGLHVGFAIGGPSEHTRRQHMVLCLSLYVKVEHNQHCLYL